MQDIEISTINNLIENNYHVIIVFTKADLVPEVTLNEYKKIVLSEFDNSKISICEVCSEEMLLRNGKTEKFGRDELINVIVDSFWNTMIARLPERCSYILKSMIGNWQREQQLTIKSRNSGIGGYFNFNAIYEDVAKDSRNFEIELKEKIKEVVNDEVFYTVSVFNYFSSLYKINTDIENFSFDVSINKISTRGLLPSLIGGIVLSGLTTFFIGELFGLSKAFAINEVYSEVDRFANSLREEVDKLQPKIREVLEKLK